MTKSLGNLALAGYDDIFNVGAGEASIREIPLAELFPPEFHPFQVNNDEAMRSLVESIKQYGVREPGLARPRSEGGYELLCGNRRKMACELAGIATLPVIVRELDDDQAVVAMVDSNILQRETLLFSERAWAYRMKMEALNHKGVKAERNSVEILAEQTGEKRSQIFRLICLTELVVNLLDKVDARKLAVNAAVELSCLSQKEQIAVADAMEKYAVKPSLSQAVRLKKLKQAGTLTIEAIDEILAEEKKSPQNEPSGSMRFSKFFPPEYSKQQIEAVITGLLREWQTAQATT